METPKIKICAILAVLAAAALACNLSQPTVSTATSTPVAVVLDVTEPTAVAATETATEPPTATDAPFSGSSVSFGPLSLVLPPGIAGGLSGSDIPRDDGPDVPPWGLTPGHTVVNLEGYLLQGKFHEPRIFLYPAAGYAELLPGAFESMDRLRSVLDDPALGADLENLPFIPFFNAAPVFASNFKVVRFQNGDGVRFLTEYAQYFAPVNNHDLFYHFQGFSDDGETYIIAIIPITAPVLAETGDPGAALPPDGIPLPDIDDPEADFQVYYAAISGLLSAMPADSFSPSIEMLDLLIRSLKIE